MITCKEKYFYVHPPRYNTLTTRQSTIFGTIRFLLVFIYAASALYYPAQAETDSPSQEINNHELTSSVSANKSKDIEDITKSILSKELELERLNTHFRLETTLVGPWRQRRLFAYGESSASLTGAGLLTALPVDYNLSRKKVAEPAPDDRNRHRLADAIRTQLVGQLIGAGGDVFELGLNFIDYLSIRKKGFNPGAYRKRVQVLHIELDNLLEQRRAMLNRSTELSGEDIQIAQAEGKLLSDMRDLSLREYGQYLTGTKRFWAFQNTAFLVDFAKNSTGAAGNIINLVANNLHRPRMAGGGYLLSAISGVIVVLVPGVGRVTGNLSGLAAQKTISKELPNIQGTHTETFLLDKQQLLALTSKTTASSPNSQGTRKRLALYDQQGELLLRSREFSRNQRDEARRTLKENILFASIVGPPRIAYGTLGMIGSWHYYHNEPDRYRLYAAGATSYLVGTTFNMAEEIRVQALIELNDRKLAKSHLLPKQQFMQKLQRLDDMDQILTK